MSAVFQTVLEMSLTASAVILIVLLARTLLSKAPKKYAYLLWIVVAFRLCVPFSFESEISIFNTADAIPSFKTETTVSDTVPELNPDLTPEISDTVNAPSAPVAPDTDTAVLPEGMPTVPDEAPAEITQPDRKATLTAALAIIWLIGIVCMLCYGIVSYFRLKQRLQNAVLLFDNVYGSDRIGSPFALGFFRPRIYIPFGMSEESTSYILAHERYHLKRLDHLVKPLSFLILCVHWFNPLCWLAFNRMSLDMELSCDERVLKQYGDENMKKKYSKTLLDFATDRRYPSPAPISFSEGAGAKTRIKHALYWKKPKFWVSAVALLLCAVVLVACAANAVSNDPSGETASDRIIEFGDTPYRFTFTSNGDGTCKITDIKTDFDRTEPYDLVIPATSPDGDKVVEVDMGVLGYYKDILNVPGALTEESFASVINRIQTSEFKGDNGVDAETAAKAVSSFYNRRPGNPSPESKNEYSYVVLENHIAIEESTGISAYLTDYIGYTAEDCYADCIKVTELDVSEETAAALREQAFRYFYHNASYIKKVILPNADIKVHQGFLGLSYALADGTAFVPEYENPVQLSLVSEDADIILDDHANVTIRLTFTRPVRSFAITSIDEGDGYNVSIHSQNVTHTFDENTSFVYSMYLNDITDSRGFVLIGEDGRTHYYAINGDWNAVPHTVHAEEVTDIPYLNMLDSYPPTYD